jgi:hypothetical protein
LASWNYNSIRLIYPLNFDLWGLNHSIVLTPLSVANQYQPTQPKEAHVNSKSGKIRKKWWMIAVGLLSLAGMVLFLSPGDATETKANKKKINHIKAFQLHNKKCLSCHVSVADPERPGRTRDDWHMVVNVMHGYGFDLTKQEAEAITDFLYDLRQGIEKDAG